MRVLIPGALRSYTRESRVEAQGATLHELLADLERQFPGIRFRIVDEQERLRANMRVFVAGAAVHDLARPLQPNADVCIVLALSGG